jgi:nucleoside phosphorylase
VAAAYFLNIVMTLLPANRSAGGVPVGLVRRCEEHLQYDAHDEQVTSYPYLMSTGRIEPTIGIVTALSREHSPFTLLTSEAATPPLRHRDPNLYTIGRMRGNGGMHDVALVVLPKYGNNLAAIATTHMLRTFESIEDVIFSGIAGGIPRPDDPKRHVRLGDIVVTDGKGVIQFDLGVRMRDRFTLRGSSPPPSPTLMQAARALDSRRRAGTFDWARFFKEKMSALRIRRPRVREQTRYQHPRFAERQSRVPYVHHGNIGASNAKIKDATIRDRVAREFDLLAIEMEGSGLADAAWDLNVGYYVVRSACDYADKHAADQWQTYAAGCAATFVAALLEHLPLNEKRDTLVNADATIITSISNLKNEGRYPAVVDSIQTHWAEIASWPMLVNLLETADLAGDVRPLEVEATLEQGLPKALPAIRAAQRFYEGRLLSQKGSVNEAMARHRENVRARDDVGIYRFRSAYEVAHLYFRVESFARAKEEFRIMWQSITGEPDEAAFNSLRADILKFRGTFELLPLVFAVPFAKLPRGQRSNPERALVYAREAATFAERANYVDGHGWASVVKAFAYEALNQPKCAEDHYQKGREELSHPLAYRTSIVYAMLYHAAFKRRQRHFRDAEELLAQTFDLVPPGSNHARAEVYEERAVLANIQRRRTFARDQMSRAVSLYSRYDPAFRDRAREWPKVARLRKTCVAWGCSFTDDPFAGTPDD